MEESIFPEPAVAGILKKHYVEARLHMDVPPSQTEYLALQERLVGSVALPTYVLVDPRTEERVAIQRGWLPSVDGYAQFLRSALED